MKGITFKTLPNTRIHVSKDNEKGVVYIRQIYMLPKDEEDPTSILMRVFKDKKVVYREVSLLDESFWKAVAAVISDMDVKKTKDLIKKIYNGEQLNISFTVNKGVDNEGK